jgi:hypothetical protein
MQMNPDQAYNYAEMLNEVCAKNTQYNMYKELLTDGVSPKYVYTAVMTHSTGFPLTPTLVNIVSANGLSVATFYKNAPKIDRDANGKWLRNLIDENKVVTGILERMFEEEYGKKNEVVKVDSTPLTKGNNSRVNTPPVSSVEVKKQEKKATKPLSVQEDAPAEVKKPKGDAIPASAEKQKDAPAEVKKPKGDAIPASAEKQEDAPAEVKKPKGDAIPASAEKQEDAPAKVKKQKSDAIPASAEKQEDAPAKVKKQKGEARKPSSVQKEEPVVNTSTPPSKGDAQAPTKALAVTTKKEKKQREVRLANLVFRPKGWTREDTDSFDETTEMGMNYKNLLGVVTICEQVCNGLKEEPRKLKALYEPVETDEAMKKLIDKHVEKNDDYISESLKLKKTGFDNIIPVLRNAVNLLRKYKSLFYRDVNGSQVEKKNHSQQSIKLLCGSVFSVLSRFLLENKTKTIYLRRVMAAVLYLEAFKEFRKRMPEYMSAFIDSVMYQDMPFHMICWTRTGKKSKFFDMSAEEIEKYKKVQAEARKAQREAKKAQSTTSNDGKISRASKKQKVASGDGKGTATATDDKKKRKKNDTPKVNVDDTPKDNVDDTPKDNVDDTPKDNVDDTSKVNVDGVPDDDSDSDVSDAGSDRSSLGGGGTELGSDDELDDAESDESDSEVDEFQSPK